MSYQLYQKKVFIACVFLGVMLSIGLSFINRHAYNISFDEYGGDARIYNDVALALVERGTTLTPDGHYFGHIRRAPGYPLFLAMFYSISPSPFLVWIVQSILFSVGALLLWSISKRFLPESWSLFPALLFLLSWFVATFVIRINSDFLGMFCTLLFVWAYMKYRDHDEEQKNLKMKYLFLSLSFFALSFAALVRPIFLYAVVLMVLFTLFLKWRHAFVALIISTVILGPWMVHSYFAFNTFQLSDTGYIMKTRAESISFSQSVRRASYLAALFGDVVADQFYPGYKDNPEPGRSVSIVIADRKQKLISGVPEYEFDKIYYRESLKTFLSHPMIHAQLSFFTLVRLNQPPNQNGVSMFHFLAEHEEYPLSIRIIMNLLIRIIWFGFIGMSIIGAYLFTKAHYRMWKLLVPLLFIVLYTNATHALFTHAEFRFILPAIPFYILFFVYASWYITESFKWGSRGIIYKINSLYKKK